ncbi:putative tetratricopeptide-like helical domain superfamily [Helianthus annuus]|nr:putative tetratricopeptide-like helical domain superfamily [Helianthus annuus]
MKISFVYLTIFIKKVYLSSMRNCCLTGIRKKDVVCWNSMIDAYVKAGEMELARLVFDEMSCRDVVSWNSVINGYGVVGSLDEAKKLFDQIPERNVDAVKMFRDMPRRDVVSWNAILACYAQNGKSNEALALFDEIKVAGVRANEATVVSVLSEIGQCHGPRPGLTRFRSRGTEIP